MTVAAEAGGARGLADAELAEGHALIVAGIAVAGRRQAAQQRLDAGQQDARLNRFGDVVVGAHFQAENLIEIFVARRQHQDDAAKAAGARRDRLRNRPCPAASHRG
jgi:hypothetical protein